MGEEPRYTESEAHQKFAKDCFNFVWTLLEKTQRTPQEDDLLLHAVHAMWFHWNKIGKPVNMARAEWQVSRVCATLGQGGPSLHHAQLSLDICRSEGIGDFDLAFAYEALARASAVSGLSKDRDHYLNLAEQAGQQVAEEEDRKIFVNDLATIPR